MAKFGFGSGSVQAGSTPILIPECTLSARPTDPMRGSQMPNRLLESVIPGYSVLSAILSNYFGLDTSLLVSISLSAFVFITLTRYIVQKILTPLCTCQISINSDDDIYEHVMQWLAGQKVTENGRKLIASSKRAKWDDGSVADKNITNYVSGGGVSSAIPSPRYEPAYGNHMFWHDGSFFILHRSIKPIPQSNVRMRGSEFPEQETISITSVSFSTKSIKKLLTTAAKEYAALKASRTSIRVPIANSQTIWRRLASIPSRSLSTLCLPLHQTEALVSDLRQFLSADEKQFYRERGIPYRRGYLLFGSPGTGKTSLCHVLAGHFGLDIHVINLLEPTLTEFKLTSLFQNMPPQCIVLLEDIDSAGLEKRKQPGASGDDGVRKRRVAAKDDGQTGGISLSILLNVIDGLVAHEGRVLLMTTNYPEKLDAALTRPGRVDMKVHLELSTKEQMKQLFVRMFRKRNTPEESNESTEFEKIQINEKPVDAELLDQANEFANRLPERVLSPAELQGYLLLQRHDPQRAIDEAEAWKNEILEEREKARKLEEEDEVDNRTEEQKTAADHTPLKETKDGSRKTNGEEVTKVNRVDEKKNTVDAAKTTEEDNRTSADKVKQ